MKCSIVPLSNNVPTHPMLTAPCRKRNEARCFPAFSLVELLAVIAMIAGAVPVFTETVNSTRANLIVIRNQPGATIFTELRDL